MSLASFAGWRGTLLALVAGSALPLAFAPLNLHPLGPLSVAGLFLLWTAATPRRAAILGYAFGLGMFTVGATWVYISFLKFGGIPVWMGVLLTVGFVLIMAVYPALAGYVANRWFRGEITLRLLLIYPLLWTAAEWLRGWLFTGFNWLNLGSAQIETPFAGFVPIFGGYGVSAVVAILAGALACLVVRERARQGWAVAVIFGLPIMGGLLNQVAWTEPSGPPLRATLVQGNVPQEEKWQRSGLNVSLHSYLDLSRANWDSAIVVWPETAIPAFRHRVEESYLQPLSEEAGEHGVSLLLGVPVRADDSSEYFNSMIALGAGQGRYDKRHLVPFGEYLPMKSALAAIVDFLEIPLSDFSSGDDLQSLPTLAGYPVGVSICYEDAYGREVAEALPQAQILVNASNDAWFGDSLAPPNTCKSPACGRWKPGVIC